ncbi:alternative ribosomal protein L7A [[Clostridium] ultunense Esp]|uniref:50S ribosomal protein L7ae-like protein n=1 Tax=Thermicanus aegyptius TaxID=94009 RepID=UPI0002B70FA2|nr:50S ribosomal protein L7ae-like protein [Thermicanus aegyptius]CCQ93758.1 alternative ribosomal protein L7A [[Clostridium] ultunense Esp]
MSYEKVKQAKEKIVGTKRVMKAIEKGQVLEVIIASDAESRVTSPILERCREKNLTVTTVDSMKKLGRACGIEVGAAVVALPITTARS